MDWLKRNLLFAIGGAVALVLMGLAGYFLYTGMEKNNAALERLNAEYTELKRLNGQTPNPGNDTTDNIKAAKAQEQEVRAFITKTARVFQPVSPIPGMAELTNASGANASFAGALRRTIDQMRKDASSAGVQVPPNYLFSFASVKDRIQFDKEGLIPLATQLGEVKAICDVLFASRINALDSIRREKVSKHDLEFQQTTDYTHRVAVTNQVGVVTPYEVSIRCFSGELASILAGFASSPRGLLVSAINVEPALAAGGPASGASSGSGLEAASSPQSGSPSGGAPGSRTPPSGTSVAKGGLTQFLDEKQLRVNLLIEVVKLASKK
jgi:hypothetical protein